MRHGQQRKRVCQAGVDPFLKLWLSELDLLRVQGDHVTKSAAGSGAVLYHSLVSVTRSCSKLVKMRLKC